MLLQLCSQLIAMDLPNQSLLLLHLTAHLNRIPMAHHKLQ
jgi:hypothetical protein